MTALSPSLAVASSSASSSTCSRRSRMHRYHRAATIGNSARSFSPSSSSSTNASSSTRIGLTTPLCIGNPACDINNIITITDTSRRQHRRRRQRAVVISNSSGSPTTSAGGDDGDTDGANNAPNSCSLKFIQEIKEKMDDPLAESNATALALVFLTVLAVVGYISSGLGSINATNNIQVAVQLVVQAVAKTGFTAAFALIFISELGDKTFFIAALLAMRMGRMPVIIGATSALGLMSVISVVIGRVFSAVPASFSNTIPIGEYIAVASLMFFGLKSLKDANDMPKSTKASGDNNNGNIKVDKDGVVIEGALAEAAEDVCKAESKIKESDGKGTTNIQNIIETFCLIFVAEWGDRSMLATIALGAAQNPVGVAVGATAGHLFATVIAVIGGSLISKKISERFVAFCGGWLFLAFALFTAIGVF